MAQNGKRWAGFIFILLLAGVFIYGGFHLLHMQRAGTATQATVTSCTKRGRAVLCRGSWFVNGRVTLGVIENAHFGDEGQRIEVRALGDRAIKPGLRLPIILWVLGLGVAVLGVVNLKKAAPK